MPATIHAIKQWKKCIIFYKTTTKNCIILYNKIPMKCIVFYNSIPKLKTKRSLTPRRLHESNLKSNLKNNWNNIQKPTRKTTVSSLAQMGTRLPVSIFLDLDSCFWPQESDLTWTRDSQDSAICGLVTSLLILPSSFSDLHDNFNISSEATNEMNEKVCYSLTMCRLKVTIRGTALLWTKIKISLLSTTGYRHTGDVIPFNCSAYA
jgi:hypothetical protein